MPKPLEPGDPARLGRFELVARLGEGGQGVVYLGRGSGPGEDRVAVKVLRSTVDATVLERLARELDAIHQVQPFVTARVIEASAEGNRRFVVSEFIDGPSLQERVDTRGTLPVDDLHRLAVGTATALTAIHGAGVVHRDFKPANVLLGPDGPRVVDFGIARLIDAATITSGLIGTPSYIAPELLSGARATSAVDVFAWGVTMIFAATGRAAFGADTVSAVMQRILYAEPDLAGVPSSLLPVVRQCLDKDPARRPTARDVLIRLVDPSARQAQATQLAQPAQAPAAQDALPADPVAPQYLPYQPTATPSPAGSWSPGGTAPPGPRTDYGTGHYGTGPGSVPGPPHQTNPVPGDPRATNTPIAPRGTPPGGPWPSPAPARSRRGPALAISAAVVVAALIVGGVLLLTRGSPGTPTAGTGNTPGTSSPASTNSTPSTESTNSSAPATGPTIPAAFAGTWAGTVTMADIAQPGLVQFTDPITFMLASGGRTAHEVDKDCVNTLTLTGATASVLTFDEPQTPACQAGTVTFTRHGANLAYRWTDQPHLVQQTGTLHKAG